MKLKYQILKQIPSIVLCLTLMLTYVPLTAMAAEESAIAADGAYTVYIGGAELSVGDDGSAVYLKNDGTNGAENDYNAKLWYDTANAVLTLELNNLEAAGNSEAEAPTLQTSAGLYSEFPVTLILHGQNTVAGVGITEGSYTNVYGIYVDDITVSADTSGTFIVTTGDTKGSCYGIYSTGDVTVLGGTLNVEAGSSVNVSSSSGRESYGIYAEGSVTIGGEGLSPFVMATAGDSYGESCGIYGYKGITVKSGNTQAVAGYAQRGYADGMLANRATITVTGGTVTASSTKSNGGMTTGICANALEVSGGVVTATGGTSPNGEEQSAGIYVNYDIDISGGTVTATGGESFGDVSFGMNSWRGNITLSGDSVIYAHGGPSSYSVGLSAERRKENNFPYARAGGDMTIRDNAKVYVSTVATDEIRVYSYGIFVGGNLLVQGNPYVEAVAGPVGSMNINGLTDREKRSFGIYLGDDIYDTPSDTNYIEGGYTDTEETHTITLTGGTVIAKTLDTDNGTLATDGNQQRMNRSYAVVLYDAGQIDFADNAQPNDQWYQWKIEEQDAFTRSTNTKYSYAADWQSPTQYFHIEPLSPEKDSVYKNVIFQVVNGTWSDGSTDNITVTLELKDTNGNPAENGSASLIDSIPTGMLPFEGYGDGSWDIIPPESVSGTQDEIYIYTFIADSLPDDPEKDDPEKDDPEKDDPEKDDPEEEAPKDTDPGDESEKNESSNKTSSPPTGDNSHMALWFALLFVSGGCLLGMKRHDD